MNVESRKTTSSTMSGLRVQDSTPRQAAPGLSSILGARRAERETYETALHDRRDAAPSISSPREAWAQSRDYFSQAAGAHMPSRSQYGSYDTAASASAAKSPPNAALPYPDDDHFEAMMPRADYATHPPWHSPVIDKQHSVLDQPLTMSPGEMPCTVVPMAPNLGLNKTQMESVIPDQGRFPPVADGGKARHYASSSIPNLGEPNLRMDRLSVSSSQAISPSPLLEAYQGTYQTISMPSPLALSAAQKDDPPSLSLAAPPEGKKQSGAEVKVQRRVKIYDAVLDADAIASALNQQQVIAKSLTSILPVLSHDQLMELREEYKKQSRVHGRGINIAKHIKARTSGNFGKVCYVTALGRWESEAYWANVWYQSHSSRYELLIEALLGRTNAEIRRIKEAFKDKRYNDSLARCLEKELKPDKFRAAVLMVLEEQRQEETDVYPAERRRRDVETLYQASNGRNGGESAILGVVVRRSDKHLRAVLQSYEATYGRNLARQVLEKSKNLVVSRAFRRA